MAGSVNRRIGVLAGVVASAVALLLPASPAQAQTGGPGAQATPVVGVSGTANCPTNVAANQVVYAGPAGAFTIVQSAGSCTSLSANAAGTYTIGGSGSLPFSASCQVGGLQTGGAVDVPAGTVVYPGTPQEFTTTTVTTITTLNTPVRYPNGTTAVLNQVTTTDTTVTRNAIVADGVIIGQVVCGAAAPVYPLAVEAAAGASSPAPALPAASTGGGGGLSTGLLLLGGAFVLAVAAQLTIGRKVMRRKGDAAG